jgi:hypothetical protein
MCTFDMLDGRTEGYRGTFQLRFLPAPESSAGLMKRSSGSRAISGVTFFGLKRSARAAACSVVDSPPHVTLNDNGEMTEERDALEVVAQRTIRIITAKATTTLIVSPIFQRSSLEL